MRDQLAFKLVGWAVAKRRVQALGVVNVLDEPRQTLRDILERLIATDVDVLDLQVFMKLSAWALWYGLPTELIEPGRLASVRARR